MVLLEVRARTALRAVVVVSHAVIPKAPKRRGLRVAWLRVLAQARDVVVPMPVLRVIASSASQFSHLLPLVLRGWRDRGVQYESASPYIFLHDDDRHVAG